MLLVGAFPGAVEGFSRTKSALFSSGAVADWVEADIECFVGIATARVLLSEDGTDFQGSIA